MSSLQAQLSWQRHWTRQAIQGFGAGGAGVYVDEGPDRDALTAALSREHYVPVYLDPKTVRSRHRSRGCAFLPACCMLPPAIHCLRETMHGWKPVASTASLSVVYEACTPSH